jgi:hypothetical protein
MTEEVGSSWAVAERRGGSKQRRGSLRMRIGTTKERRSYYVLHLNKSKGGRKREMDRDRREKGEKVIDELCG